MLARTIAGMTDAELAAVAAGPDDPTWTAHEAALLRAADELHRETTVADDTWATLTADHDDTAWATGPAGFGAAGEGYFRISAFNSRAKVEEVCQRIAKLLG